MKFRIFILLLLFIQNVKLSYSQYVVDHCIPDSRIVNWAEAGTIDKSSLRALNIIDVTDYGAIVDDYINDSPAINMAIEEYPSKQLVFRLYILGSMVFNTKKRWLNIR